MANSAGSGTSINQPTGALLDEYQSALPGLTSVQNQQLQPTAQTQLQTAQQTNPGYQALANSNTQAGGSSLASLLSGSGGQAAQAGQSLNQLLNPNYYGNIATATGVNNAAATQASNLLGAINLNGLSPGEFNATQRAQNQGNIGSGNLGLNNNTNSIMNAMNFGGAFNSKLGLLGNALGSASGVSNAATGTANAASSNAGFSPTGTASSAFQLPSNPQTASNAQSANTATGGQVLGAISPLANSQNQFNNQTEYANSIQGIAGSFGGGNGMSGGNGCCFIFLESYNGTLPWFVRECRNYYYKQNPRVARGYVKMANWLVPLMRRYRIVKSLVNILMVKPITKYGGWLCDVEGYSNCNLYKPFKSFWFTVWNYLGKGDK